MQFRLRTPLLIVLLIATVAICYFPSFQGQFIRDDLAYITKNKTLHPLKGLKDVWLELRSTPNYYPALFPSFWLQYQLWGDHPLGYHVVSVLLHIINAFLVWKLFSRLKVCGAFAAALNPCLEGIADFVKMAQELMLRNEFTQAPEIFLPGSFDGKGLSYRIRWVTVA